MPYLRRCIAVVAALLFLVAPSLASASIWTPITTPTTSTITALAYRGGDNLWIATSSAIYKRNGSGWITQLTRPGANFSDIEFNPSLTVGIAVGDNGTFYRYTGGGWQPQTLYTYNAPDTYCDDHGTTYAPTLAITDPLLHVHWVTDSEVYVSTGRWGSLLRSENAGATFSDVNRQPNGDCRASSVISDADSVPANPDYIAMISPPGCNSVFLSTNGLRSTAVLRGRPCDGGQIWIDPDNTQDMFAGGAGGGTYSYSEDGGQRWSGVPLTGGALGTLSDYDRFGQTSLGAGDGGYIVTSTSTHHAYFQPAGGSLLTEGWRSVSVASATSGAVGGENGALVVSDQLQSIVDNVKPTGSISGPQDVTVGSAGTWSLTTGDADPSSGINEGSLSWTLDGAPAGNGRSVTLSPGLGYHTLVASFADNQGNAGSTSFGFSVERVDDDTDPTVTITGPDVAVVGTSATYTAHASDAGGAGLNPNSIRWTRNGATVGSGATVSIPFTEQGEAEVQVTVADNNGNQGTGDLTVGVAPKPGDRPVATPAPVPPPKATRKGGYYVIPVKGGYNLPPKIPAKFGCTGEVLMTVKKAKTLLTARTTGLNQQCGYKKQVKVAKRKVGSAKTMKFTIRFGGNKFLAPVKRTYTVKVPK